MLCVFFFTGVWCVRFGGGRGDIRSHFVIEMVSIVIVEDMRHMKWRALYIDVYPNRCSFAFSERTMFAIIIQVKARQGNVFILFILCVLASVQT